MAHSLNLVVVAEGVETLAQQHYLLRHRCDQIPGYLVSQPLPAARAAELMMQRTPLHPGALPEEVRQTVGMDTVGA